MNSTMDDHEDYLESQLVRAVKGTYMMITIVLIVFNNLMILLVVKNSRSIKPVTGMLMTWLALTDLLVGAVLAISFISIIKHSWIFGNIVCTVFGTLMGSILNVFANLIVFDQLPDCSKS